MRTLDVTGRQFVLPVSPLLELQNQNADNRVRALEAEVEAGRAFGDMLGQGIDLLERNQARRQLGRVRASVGDLDVNGDGFERQYSDLVLANPLAFSHPDTSPAAKEVVDSLVAARRESQIRGRRVEANSRADSFSRSLSNILSGGDPLFDSLVSGGSGSDSLPADDGSSFDGSLFPGGGVIEPPLPSDPDTTSPAVDGGGVSGSPPESLEALLSERDGLARELAAVERQPKNLPGSSLAEAAFLKRNADEASRLASGIADLDSRIERARTTSFKAAGEREINGVPVQVFERDGDLFIRDVDSSNRFRFVPLREVARVPRQEPDTSVQDARERELELADAQATVRALEPLEGREDDGRPILSPTDRVKLEKARDAVKRLSPEADGSANPSPPSTAQPLTPEQEEALARELLGF